MRGLASTAVLVGLVVAGPLKAHAEEHEPNPYAAAPFSVDYKAASKPSHRNDQRVIHYRRVLIYSSLLMVAGVAVTAASITRIDDPRDEAAWFNTAAMVGAGVGGAMTVGGLIGTSVSGHRLAARKRQRRAAMKPARVADP